jgi:chromosomal replication initiation ATPase DnaA
MGELASLTPQFQMNANQLWQTVLGDLRTALSRTAFDNWLRDTRLIAFDEDVATIAAQSSIVVATLESRFAPRVASALSDAVGRQVGSGSRCSCSRAWKTMR